jgi:nucleotide-binding universal stress UspA family protein
MELGRAGRRNRVLTRCQSPAVDATLRIQPNEGVTVRGTIVCGVTDGDEGHAALGLGVELSQRLGLRLVLAHVAEGLAPLTGDGDDNESVTMKANRNGGELFLARVARDYGVGDTAERRVAVGEPAMLVGQIAAEEAADMIVVGSRARRWPGRCLESRLAEGLESETPVPILIAPPASGRRRTAVAANSAR